MTESSKKQAEIYELQTMLRLLAQTDGSIPSVNPDGIFGPETERAVLAFQGNMGLLQTGTVDFQTWTAITKAYRTAQTMTQRGLAFFPFPANGYTVSKNEKSDLVCIIQIMLSGVGVAYDLFSDIGISGIYDTETESAVRAFQKFNRLPQTGTVDVFTWNRLASAHNLLATNPIYTE
jgi:peptidoglycan hydrolase-like protein with peptidoglycan-binding domain